MPTSALSAQICVEGFYLGDSHAILRDGSQ